MSMDNDNAASAPLFIELRPGMRKALADAVEAFLNLLDQIDADADLEEDNPPEDDAPCEDVGDDEPSLGSVGSRDASSRRRYGRTASPTMTGSTRSEPTSRPATKSRRSAQRPPINQAHAWRASRWGSVDEAEPSLGWTGHGRGHPEMALRGYGDEREHDDERE